MSPSRIPRPGGIVPPSPLGPRGDYHRGNNSINNGGDGNFIRSAPGSPSNFSPKSPSYKTNGNGIGSDTQSRPGMGMLAPAPNLTRARPSRRRPKPPSPDFDDEPIQPTTPCTPTLSPQYNQPSQPGSGQAYSRRPVPPSYTGIGSPDCGLPRPARSTMTTNGNGFPGGGGPQNGNGDARSCLRQPSTPLLKVAAAAGRSADMSHNAKTRSRAVSAAADTRINRTSLMETAPPAPLPMLFAPSFAESREPSVPLHIRLRLRLIHQLGVVLGIDAQGISSKIDVPGLLARVDAAYDRGHPAISMSRKGSVASVSSVTSGLPLSKRPIDETILLEIAKQSEAKLKAENNKGVMGMLKRFGRGSTKDERNAANLAGPLSEGPVFGVPLNDAPPGTWCTSLIAGQKHELPLVVFTVIEEIYRRGMSQAGIFRLAGDGTRISHLTKVFNLPPLYGDSLTLSAEPIHNLTGLVKRYIRDLPEPILDDSLFPAFLAFCAEPEPGTLVLPLSTRISAAQILLKLLPPLHFSLLIYMLAFLGQLPLYPDNRLNVESISIIFGPAICAMRGKGIAGLGPSTMSGRGIEHDPDDVSNLVNQSQTTLAWLLHHWPSISEKVLDPPFEDDQPGGGKVDKKEKDKDKERYKVMLDPRLLSPIDLRRNPSGAADSDEGSTSIDSSPFIRGRLTTSSQPLADGGDVDEKGILMATSTAVIRDESTSSSSTFAAGSDTAATTSTPSSGAGPAKKEKDTLSSSISPSPSASSGIFARAFSSINLASQARDQDQEEVLVAKVPRRSASFTSLSSLVRKGGALMRGDQQKGAGGRVSQDTTTRSSHEGGPRVDVNSQITNVLGSLHDLLVSKDTQIERDARELAMLRHALLEMDERLSRMSCPSCGCNDSSSGVGTGNGTEHSTIAQTPTSMGPHTPTPAITITSTVSATSISLAHKDKEIHEMQAQLTTALAALETARLQSRKQAEKTLVLESKLARADAEKRLERSKLEVSLALEQAKVMGLMDERNLARERLEKVKTTLFALS